MTRLNRAWLLFLGTIVWFNVQAFGASEREIKLTTKKINNAVHWVVEGTPPDSDKVEVKPGEKVKFIVTHKLDGGFEVHGFTIKALGIEKQVKRNEKPPMEVVASIPKTLKPGDYPIGCQFHPSHVPATLVVKADAPAAGN